MPVSPAAVALDRPRRPRSAAAALAVTIAVIGGLLAAAAPASAAAAPAPPRAVTARSAAPGTLTVSWAAPASTSDLQWFTAFAYPGRHVLSAPGSARSLTYTGLAAGTYSVSVSALHRSGWSVGVGGNSVRVAPATTVAVTSVSATLDATATTAPVRVAWTVPPGTAGIRWFTATAQPGGIKISAPATAGSVVFPALAGGTYRFGVAALNQLGWGTAATSGPVTVPTATVPAPPTAVTAVLGDRPAASDSAPTPVTVSWAPGATGRGAVRWYTVFAWPGGATLSAPATADQATFTGLSAGVRYTFSVSTLNTVGWSRSSAPSNSVRLPGGVQTVPGPPADVTATLSGSTATLRWAAPVDDGHSDLRWYTITQYPSGARTSVGADVTSATFTHLPTGTNNYWSIQVLNATGWSTAGLSNGVLTGGPPPAQRTPAPISTSRYIRDIRGVSGDAVFMRADGAADAAANPSGHAYLTLLDIGGQFVSGGARGVILSATSTWVSDAGLVAAVDAYVDGYASAQRAVTPTVIAIGTNNDGDVDAADGADWARSVIDPVVAHARPYSAITIAGADDIEPGFSATPADTLNWLGGYLSSTSATYVFNGSADGCDTTQALGGCNHGWTAAQLYQLGGGLAPGRSIALPQIYNSAMAAQWKLISLTGVLLGRPRLDFGGPLTEWTACQQSGSCGSYTGNTAWNTLWADLQSDGRLAPSSLPYSTDLRIN